MADDVEGFRMGIGTQATHLLIRLMVHYCEGLFNFTVVFAGLNSVVVMVRFLRALLRLSRVAMYLPTHPPTLRPLSLEAPCAAI